MDVERARRAGADVNYTSVLDSRRVAVKRTSVAMNAGQRLVFCLDDDLLHVSFECVHVVAGSAKHGDGRSDVGLPQVGSVEGVVAFLLLFDVVVAVQLLGSEVCKNG